MNDLYIAKLNASGVLQWSKTVGGTGPDRAYSIIQSTDGGYLIAGKSQSFAGGGVFIVKLDASGNACGNFTSPPSISGTGGTIISLTPKVTSLIPSITAPTLTISSGGTVNTICLVGIQPISNEIPVSYQLYQNYPNPFNPSTNINFALPKKAFVKLTIYDALGREAAELVNSELNPGTYSVDWDAVNFPSGIYFYQMTAGDASTPLSVTETKRMVLMK